MNSTVMDPMARELPAGAYWTRQGRLRTGAGIEIGLRAPRQPLAHGAQACALQAALLATKTPIKRRIDVDGLACAAALVALVAALMKAPAIWAWLSGVAA
jgi:hypothetical protein